jgi:hypothetical protein
MLTTIPWRMMARGCSLGVLAGLLVVAFESSDFQGEICEYNQTPKHKDCTTYSLFPFLLIKVFDTINYYGVAITALATVFIGVFTLTLKLSTDNLWTAAKDQIAAAENAAKMQSRDMQASISVAQSASNAAQDQVSLSREALIMTERAFVFCERIEHFWRAKKETKEIIEWIFFPVWKNSGNTPTKHGMGCVNTWLAVDAGDLPHDFTFPDYGSAERIMIGPNLQRNGLQLSIPIETMHKIREGTAHAYMWGWAEYNTIFTTDTIRHRSEFCVEIQVTGNPIYKEGGFAFRAHGPFNGFDDECYRKPKPYE